ncbi:MAG: DUF1122 family protein [Candidatus Thermoplasmatota archaeon]|nr:DUF1122 family protein [Candidatus Thermoplasmatota archaeon]
MDLPLENIEKKRLGDWSFQVDVRREVERPHPVTIVADHPDHGAGHIILQGRTNPGTAWRHPWLEARYLPPFEDEATEERFWSDVLPQGLVPGSYLMISCDGHPGSLSALTVDVPPQTTRIGYLLWLSGARWYKVWYYPEGWREGHEKLQGNLPMDEAHRARATADRLEELPAFLEGELAERFPRCAARARELLDAKPA